MRPNITLRIRFRFMRLPLAFDFQRLFGNVVDFLHHLDGKGTGVIHGGHTKNPDGDLRRTTPPVPLE